MSDNRTKIEWTYVDGRVCTDPEEKQPYLLAFHEAYLSEHDIQFSFKELVSIQKIILYELWVRFKSKFYVILE